MISVGRGGGGTEDAVGGVVYIEQYDIAYLPCVIFTRNQNIVEKPAKTQTSIRLASHLVRAPNS